MVRHTTLNHTPVQHATFVFHVYVLAFHESAAVCKKREAQIGHFMLATDVVT